MDTIKIALIIYIVIAVTHFCLEYHSIKRSCKKFLDTYYERPKLDYCFFRALFFPVTWIRLMWKYTK